MEKIDLYNQRKNNKIALEKKKRRLDKLSWVKIRNTFENTWETFKWNSIPKKWISEWIIVWVKHVNQKKFFEVLSFDKTIIESFLDSEIPWELWDQIVIWDLVLFIKKDLNFLIIKREKRKNKLSRLKWDSDRFGLWNRVEQVIASNIDYWIIVASAKDPDFHADFIDRYNILMEFWNVKPIICITKSDLSKINDPVLNWYEKELWIKVFYISVNEWIWLEELKKEITWKKVVLVWNSWVWKSTLTNYLRWNQEIKTLSVSEKTWQWRHTTTSSALYEWEENSFIIDTPWIRSLDLVEISKDDLKYYFKEFDKYSNDCKFNDCTHTHEPDCAIKKIVNEWVLSKERYESYLRILNNLV